jgi:hypothetical protein
MKLVLVLAVILSVAGAAHAEQYKQLPVKSYVLTDPDGTPRYLVQHSEKSNFRTVYYVKPVEQENSSPPQRGNRSRPSAPEKRFTSKRSWEQFNRHYGFTEM